MIVAGHQVAIADATDPIYNGFDCCGTYQINDARIELRQNDDLIYRFERALMGVVMEMTLRGFLVDMEERERAIIELGNKRAATWTNLSNIISSIGCNFTEKLPNSGKQLQHLFYDIMNLTPIKKTVMGETKFPMDRATLEKLEISDKFASPIINGILTHRDLGKSLQVLETEIDNDWRWRCSYNIAGTKTGRFSSSKSPFMVYNESDQAWRQTGNNFQNISEILRRVFIPDPGFKLYGIDKAQSEARDVGWFLGTILNDWKYLDACECLTEDHEVLTPNGWVPICTMPPVILEWNWGTLQFCNVIKWNEGQTDKLISMNNRNLDLIATYNHKMPVFIGKNSNRLSKRSLEQIIQAPNYKAPLTGILNSICGIDEPIADLLAAFQADGTRDNKGKVHWTFTKSRKIDLMEKLLNKHNFKYSRYELTNGNVRFYLNTNQGQDKWAKECGPEILSWSLTTLQEFCNSHNQWDASITEDNISIVSKSKSHIEWLATAYMLIGKSSTIRPHKQMYWELTIKNNLNTQYRSCEITKINSGPKRVYCPTVPSGNFMVRRNNKIFPSGNSGDLHTNVTRMLYPEWNWTGNLKKDREIAERRFYRFFTYRDASKRLGHASNYLGEPFEISRQTRIPLNLVQEFQDRYFDAFPIREMHQFIIAFLQMERYLINSYGRRRDFFDRPTDRETWKSAIAYMFQSATADAVNLGLYRLWKNMGTDVQILSQLHDAVYFQYPLCTEKEELDMLEKAVSNIEITQRSKSGRTMTIPGEVVGGYNWAHKYRLLADGTKEMWNPNGLDGIRLH